MQAAIAASPLLPLIRKHKWPLIFALAGLLVGLSGLVAAGTAFAQFGPLNKLASPDATSEFHCSQPLKPPGNGTITGGSAAPCIDPGDTAFMYTAASFVMIMTPGGVGFLYGGLTRRKNALTVILQNFLVYAIVSIQWVIYGYSIMFGPDATGHDCIGLVRTAWCSRFCGWNSHPHYFRFFRIGKCYVSGQATWLWQGTF